MERKRQVFQYERTQNLIQRPFNVDRTVTLLLLKHAETETSIINTFSRTDYEPSLTYRNGSSVINYAINTKVTQNSQL